MTKTVTILCAAPKSIYHTISGVDVFDAARDARTFTGSSPIVAHPPCGPWSAYCAHQSKAPAEVKALGPWCVQRLRENGGVLEHPAHSRLFAECGLPKPGEGDDHEWTAEVYQSAFGDPRSKKTWLCFFHVPRASVNLPEGKPVEGSKRIWNTLSKHRRAATPPRMARWLINAASQAKS